VGPGRNLGLGVLAGLAGVALTFLLWGATPHLLLGKDLGGWRGLVPTAIAGTVVTVGLRLLSLLLLPRWLASWAIPLGAIGTSLALLLVVQLLATGWVVVAALRRRLLGTHRRPGPRHPGRTRGLSHHGGDDGGPDAGGHDG
jgi:hypothetical protein